jgi:hypothetical protein
MAAAGLVVATMLTVAAAPAMADPTQPPSAGQAAGGGALPGGGTGTGVKPKPGEITWAVQPSSLSGPDGRSAFTYNNLKPGTVITDYVGVTNFSATAVTFTLYATDAFNTSTGSLDLLPAKQKPTDVGSWISFEKTSITVNPGSRVNERFKVSVPSTASPGDHTGGVIAAITTQARNSQGTMVQVDRRLADPLLLRVAGTLKPSIAVESVSSSYHGTVNPVAGGDVDVTYTLHNTGNSRLDLRQDVAAKGLFGLTLRSSHPRPLTDLLPGARYQTTVHLKNVFPLGPMSVQVRAVPSEVKGMPHGPRPKATAFSTHMWATPWLVLLIILVLVAGFFVVRQLLRSRREGRDRAMAEAMAKARRDTVERLRRKAAAKASVGAGTGRTGGSRASTGDDSGAVDPGDDGPETAG